MIMRKSLSLLGLGVISATALHAADFTVDVQPYLEKYCYECHGPTESKGGLSFTEFGGEAGLKSMPDILDVTMWVLEEGEMPPKTATVHPTEQETEAVVHWIDQTLNAIRNASPNDPGLVVMPRLNHREYQRVVESLTGREIDIASALTPDGSAGEGFLNVGQALQINVEQFESFLAAAKQLLEYSIPSPTEGLYWAPTPHPTRYNPQKTLAELKKFHAEALDRILLPIYERHKRFLRGTKMELGIYLEACWRYHYRDQLGMRGASFADIAQTFEEPLFASSIERLYKLLHWEQLPPTPGVVMIGEIGDGKKDSDYMTNVLNRTAPPHEFVKQNFILQMLFEKWHALAPPSGSALDQRREEVREIDNWWTGLRSRGKNEIASSRPKSKEIRERNFMGGFIGTEYYHIDPSKAKGDYLYLMVSTGMDGNETDYVVWEDGEVVFGQGKNATTKPWSEVFTDITDQDGNPVSFGRNAKGEAIDPNSIGVQAPSMLKLRIPEEVKKNTEFNVQVSLDPVHGMDASTQNRIDDKPAKNLDWLAGNRVLGKLKSRKAAIVDGAAGILGDSFRALEYRALGFTSDEERDWLENIVKDGAQLDFIDEQTARALNLPWPIPYDVAFYHTWPLQFQWPQDYLPMMTEEERAEYDQLNRIFISMIGPAQAALTRGLAQVGIDKPEAGIYPSTEQFNRLNPQQQQQIRQLAEQYQQEVALQREQAKQDLATFMTKAWRGPIQEEDVDKLLTFYDRERQAGRHHVNAVRSAMLPVLIHPRFLYRFTPATGDEVAPLSDYALASRLSFMLWGTIPDDELIQLANQGQLRNPQVLQQQVKRMLANEKSVALATEFAGLWLQFADFRESVSPDPQRFKNFTPALKEAMYDEAVLFFHHLFQNDEPVTDALFADYTFLNEELAKHYGIQGVKGNNMRKVKIDNGQRGGILGMGALLTKFSTPLRTSPVMRGHWLYEEVLGIHLPPPPPAVEPLSDDERNEEGLTVREQLEEHRDNPACFSCHDKFDPLGIALENYNPVGGWRNKDLAGEKIDNQGTFVETGRTLDGLDGLREYLRENQEKFVETFCKKLIGYGLGRAVEVTDQPLLDAMMDAMKKNDYRPSAAIDMLVISPQFLYQRQQFENNNTAATGP